MKSKPLPAANIIALYNGGRSMKSLAAFYDVCRRRIKRILVEAGVPIRSTHEALTTAWRMGDPQRRIKTGERTSKRLIDEWKNITDPAARRNRVAAAHSARRGSHNTVNANLQRALTRQQHLLTRGFGEDALALALSGLGIPCTQQVAVGPYNLDIALTELPIAVEIEAGANFYRRNQEGLRTVLTRLDCLFSQGWCVLYVITHQGKSRHGKYPGTPFDIASVASQIVALLNRARSDSTVFGQYGVLDRHGNPRTAPGSDLEGVVRIKGF